MRKTDLTNTEERRQQIVRAAVACFNRNGLQGTSISHICKEAGVASGHLYYYFANKEELVKAVFANEAALADQYFDDLGAHPYCLPYYLGLSGNAEPVEPQDDRLVNISVVMDTLAEVSRNAYFAEQNRWNRSQFVPKLTRLVELARERGELVDGADTAAVVFAVDLVATARMVYQAAERYNPAEYSRHARTLLQHLLKFPAA